MRPFRKAFPGLCAGVLTLAGSALADMVAPGAGLLAQLADESYPKRIEAEEKLESWAREGGEEATEWLYQRWAADDNPETRQRLYRVMRQGVLRELEAEGPGFVGIQMRPCELAEEEDVLIAGVEVSAVTAGTPAEKYGLKGGDIILEVNGQGWDGEDAMVEFRDQIGAMTPGTKVNLTISRGGKTFRLDLVLASRPWSIREEALPIAPQGGGLRVVPQVQLRQLQGQLQLRNLQLAPGRRLVLPGQRAAQGGVIPPPQVLIDPAQEKAAQDRAFQEWIEKRQREAAE